MTLENNDGGPYATEMSGLVIGIVLFIAIIVLMGVMIYKKKKRSNEVGPVQVTINKTTIAILQILVECSLLNEMYIFFYFVPF